MRITMLCGGSSFYGMERMALAIASGLAARGHEVQVIASGWNDGEFIGQLAKRGLRNEVMFLGKLSRSLKPQALAWTFDALRHLPGARRQLHRHLRQNKPTAVLVYNRDWVLQTKGILRKYPTLFHVHELPRSTRIMRRAYRSLNSVVATYVCASHFIAQALIDLAAPSEKVHVVHNGIDAGAMVADASHRKATTIPTVGIVGQVAEWKGHEQLLEAMAIAHGSGKSFQTKVIGSGAPSYIAFLQERARSLGIENLIAWSGYVRDADAIYADLDVCVIPTRSDEAFGLTAAEAGIRGIPVVATRRGALPEIILHGETGFLVDPDSPEQLADKITSLTTNVALRRSLGEKARKRVLEEFTTEKMVDRMEVLCEMIATKR